MPGSFFIVFSFLPTKVIGFLYWKIFFLVLIIIINRILFLFKKIVRLDRARSTIGICFYRD